MTRIWMSNEERELLTGRQKPPGEAPGSSLPVRKTLSWPQGSRPDGRKRTNLPVTRERSSIAVPSATGSTLYRASFPVEPTVIALPATSSCAVKMPETPTTPNNKPSGTWRNNGTYLDKEEQLHVRLIQHYLHAVILCKRCKVKRRLNCRTCKLI